jgi:hypothetical protein
MYAKLQAGLQGIGSLARETQELTVARDVTGATCINQYVVVKTLGRGSYGKVKLCLNTLDGRLYAIKVCVCVWRAGAGAAAAGVRSQRGAARGQGWCWPPRQPPNAAGPSNPSSSPRTPINPHR